MGLDYGFNSTGEPQKKNLKAQKPSNKNLSYKVSISIDLIKIVSLLYIKSYYLQLIKNTSILNINTIFVM